MTQPQGIPKRLQVIEVGEALGVILPDAVLTLLGVAEGDEVIFSDVPDGVRLSRYDRVDEQMEAAREVSGRRRGALRDLSK